MSHARILTALLLTLGTLTLLAGCGGGGGGGGSSSGGGTTPPTPTGTAAIAGKIVDTTGAPVVSGVLLVDGVQQFNTAQAGGTSYASGGLTFSQGGYQINGVSTNAVHVVKVQTTVGGVTYTGSTQVSVPSSTSGLLLSNANIIVSPVNQQATVSGFIRNQSGAGVGGALVYFQSAFTNSTLTNPVVSGNVSLVAVTYSGSDGIHQAGQYEIDNLPVQNQAGTGARVYTITAADTNSSGATTNANTTLTNQTFTAGQVVAAGSGPSFTLSLTSTGVGTFTPTINLLQAFTQPDIPAFYAQPNAVTSAGARANATATAYDQIRAALSPAYAKLKATGHLAAQIKHLATAQPHATAAQNTVEMDLFFSLPDDQAGVPGPSRSSLSGFNILNNTTGTFTSYDFLQDPLANLYDDPDLGTTANYLVDTTYQFAIQSIGLNGTSILGQSPTLTVAPLEFINLTQPVDPNDTSGTVQTLTAPYTITWGGIRAVQNYSVYLYSSFPGVGTADLAQSADGTAGHQPTLAGTATSYTLPSGLTTGQEYWVVVAATAADNPANASAISVSQIVPFIAQ